MENNILVTKQSIKNTILTCRVSKETKTKWHNFCKKNNINQSKTIENMLNYIMQDNKILIKRRNK